MIAIAAFAGLVLAAGSAAAQVSEQEAANKVAEEYGVEVLKTREDEVDGEAVWLVTVMEPGGNTNSAFRVATLAINKTTGQLVPAFQHRSSGYRLPGSEGGVPRSANQPLNMQQGIWR
jgi:hypothetical protein